MYVSVHSTELKNALSKVLAVVDKKNSRPILTYTLISAKSNELCFVSTDLEVSTKVIIEANVEEDGIFCVNAKNIFDIVKELPEEKVSFRLQGNNLELNCQNINYSLLVCNTEDFPQLIFENNGIKFDLSAQNVVDIINKTSHSTAQDETRLFLCGIFLQQLDERLRAVATDGYRLAMLETDVEIPNNDILTNGIIVPKKGIQELKRLAETHLEERITFSIDETFMYVSSGNSYYLSIRLIAREYPKYQAVIPSKTTYTMHLDRNAFLNAVKRIKIMSDEKSNGIRLHINSNEMNITATNPSLGNASEKIPIEYDGKEMEIGFNARYLLETFSVHNEGDVVLELNNELSPVLIKSNTMPNFLGIVMPLKL